MFRFLLVFLLMAMPAFSYSIGDQDDLREAVFRELMAGHNAGTTFCLSNGVDRFGQQIDPSDRFMQRFSSNRVLKSSECQINFGLDLNATNTQLLLTILTIDRTSESGATVATHE